MHITGRRVWLVFPHGAVSGKCSLLISEKALDVFRRFELTLAEYVEA